jgi:lysophospholipase L1-like esterase
MGGLAAVGDSITVGGGQPRYGLLADDSWVSYVVSTGRVAYGYNAAVSGQTTEELIRGLPAVLNRRPRVVVVATGTNDTEPSKTIDLIREALEQISQAGAEPVLATIPPLVPRAPDVAVLNRGLRSLAGQYSLRLIDFNAVLADGDEFRAGLSDDGIHPNVKGSQLSLDGWGHTSLGKSSCINSYVTAYLVAQELPPPGTVCRPDTIPFHTSAASNGTAASAAIPSLVPAPMVRALPAG